MKIFPILLAITLMSDCVAIEDTKANRAAQADLYLKVNPPSEQFKKIAAAMIRDIPEFHKEHYTKSMPKNLDEKTLTKEMKELLVSTFSAGELKALAELYRTPEGRSAVEKLHLYNVTTRGPMNRAMRNAMEKTRSQLKQPARPKN